MSIRQLHIGGEVAHPNWEVMNITNSDVTDHIGDAKDLSRFKDETFEKVYASHVLEHFDYSKELLPALFEWRRVLTPDGRLYISVPNMTVICSLFLSDIDVEKKIALMRILFGGHCNQHDFHQVGFDFQILNFFLEKAGFEDVRRTRTFGIFDDTSELKLGDVLVSLNVIAVK